MNPIALEYHILKQIEQSQEPINRTNLADKLSITPIAISRTLCRLTDNSLIKAEIYSQDRRQRTYKLTKKGEEVLHLV